MIIKSYKCDRFAGLQDKSIEFDERLNIIVGHNETGKSTIIEGIRAVLFKNSKVGSKSKEDLEFKNRFLPLALGDSIDGEVVISDSSGEYELARQWGPNPLSQLLTPDAQIIKNEEMIKEILNGLLLFGQGTYDSVFFSRQRYFKEALARISTNVEAAEEIGSFLRKAVMELDGISLDRMSQKINEEIDNLLKRWDIDKNSPVNNRGVSNPYKNGCGEILTSYYEKETLRLEMKKALDCEQNLEESNVRIIEIEKRMATIKNKRDEMTKSEDDVISRSTLEPKVDRLKRELDTLTKVNQGWPQSEFELKQVVDSAEQLKKDLEKLEDEKILAKEADKRQSIKSILNRIGDTQTIIEDTTKQLCNIGTISKEDIACLDDLQRNMIAAKAKMEAGKISGTLKRLAGDTELNITMDLEKKRKLAEGEGFEAEGYIKLESGKLFELELKLGDIDFEIIRDEYSSNAEDLSELLTSLGVTSIQEATQKHHKRNELQSNILNMDMKIQGMLGDDTLEQLEDQLSSLGATNVARDINAIEKEVNEKNEEIIDVKVRINSLKNRIDAWKEEYISTDGLLQQITDKKPDLNAAEKEIENMQALPAEYSTTDQFRQELSKTRTDYDDFQVRLSGFKENYYEIERELPDSTYEELLSQHKIEEERFASKISKAKNLIKVREAFDQTKDSMEQAPFEPVERNFAKYLAMIIPDNYQVLDVNDSLEFQIATNDKGINMPIELLSSGTYDSVALALKLSIAESILGDNQGVIVLDDCLVDMDPQRKRNAAKIIKDFSYKHQIIFSTCDPETAMLLGGNTISLE
jgi:exonuclease SbcC